MRTFKFKASAFALMAAGAASAQVVDGTLDGAYGGARAVQRVNTQFGDANPPGNLGGSELDAAYATIFGGRLYMMFTGNHEPNFNKLDVFFDVNPGGENQLTGTPQYDFFNGSTWISQNFVGMRFDTGFTADYHLFSRWGSGSGGYSVDFVNRMGGGSSQVPGSTGTSPNAVGLIASGAILAGNVGPNASGTSLSQNLQFAINDNNAGGVIGGTGAANQAAALAVTTGMEFSIALADLGNPAPGTTIKISAMINNGDHNYLSNQFLGGLIAGTGNLGGDGNGGFTGNLSGINLAALDQDQFFTIAVPVPEPATVAVLGIGALALLRRRNRR